MKQTKILTFAGCLLAAALITQSLPAQNFTFTTIAGGTQGAADGLNTNAQFYGPTGVAADGAGNVYVADQGNNLIREASPLGTNWIVTTLAGSGRGSLDGTNTGALFSGPTGIAVDGSGHLYVADQYNRVIRRMGLSGTNWIVTTIAGSAGVSGTNDGTNGGALFSNPAGIALDGAGNLYVADEINNDIRKITPSGTNWIVTTVAGGTTGAGDGTNTAAQFSGPAGVAVDAAGRVYVADQFNNTIRLITPLGTNWVVTTIAGGTVAGRSDGLGTNARFFAPVSVTVDTNDNVYVADLSNDAIRKLAPLGTNWASGTNWMVSTIGGGSEGSSNGVGTNASFNLPFGVAADAFGDVYVADSANDAIRLGISSSSPPATGGVEVMITPAGAISSGAKWQADGGSLQTNGAILAGLVPGDHTISFNTIAGFTTPAPQTVPVTVRQTTMATGNYPPSIPNAGSLQVMISPAGAVAAGALWRVDTGGWQTNGGIVAGLSVGAHSLTFNTNSGWTTPSSQSVAITNSQTTLALGTYVLQTGSAQWTILPSTVVTAGAKWQVDGGSFQASGTTLAGLLPGSHVISFNTVLGWQTPASQQVTVSYAVTTSGFATYTQPSQLAGMGMVGGQFQFDLIGRVGSNYVIQVSEDLAAWTSVSTNTIPAGGSVTVTDPNTPNFARRFYRAVAPSPGP